MTDDTVAEDLDRNNMDEYDPLSIPKSTDPEVLEHPSTDSHIDETQAYNEGVLGASELKPNQQNDTQEKPVQE